MFEKMLMLIGIAIVLIGMYVLHDTYSNHGWSIELINTGFLWLILLAICIMCAILENAREELSILVSENSAELRILRQISAEQAQELKLFSAMEKKQKKQERL
jgi:hypothetical protein